MTPTPRRKLVLPESGAIAALLADVTGVNAPPPRPPGQQAGDFWGSVNWQTSPDPELTEGSPPEEPPAVTRRLSGLAAATFLSSVNWANDPAKASAVGLLLAAGGPDPWANASYLSSFTWD